MQYASMNKVKITKWFKPKFDIKDNSSFTENVSFKKPKLNSKNKHKASNRFFQSAVAYHNLLDKVEPVAVADLAVHMKKVTEVENWLISNVMSSEKVSILLLTGPTGAGKTATIRVLCKAMNIDISEWINPQDLAIKEFKGPGPIEKFAEFLVQSSRYHSLFDTDRSRKRIILIEDIPNVLIQNSTDFEGLLLKFLNQGKSPAIFICTDSKDFHTNYSQQLFPQCLRDTIGMTVISFNPVNASLLKSALNRASNIIYEKYMNLYQLPHQRIIDTIVNTCVGDIRYALNNLNFACLRGSKELPTVIKEIQVPTGTKRKRNDKVTGTLSNMYKNEAIGLLHGVGRVLYPKKIEDNTSNSVKFEHVPETIFNEFMTQPVKFVSFLQENYLKYFGNFNDACQAAEILSISELFLSDWKDDDVIAQYGLWVAVFGLMICNKNSEKKWNPVKGPRYIKQSQNEKFSENHTLKIIEKSYFDIITKSDNARRF